MDQEDRKGEDVRVAMRSYLIVSAVISSVACGAENNTGLEVASDDHGYGNDVVADQGEAVRDLGPEFVDELGRRWVRTGAVTFAPDETDVHDHGEHDHETLATSPDDLDFGSMSLGELAAALRPYHQYGSYEYTLADDDALELARSVMEAMSSEEPVFSPGSLGIGQGLIDGAADAPPVEPPDYEEYKSKVVNGESRINYHPARGLYPHRTVAQMFGAGSCTAFKMINHHTAVTAAHCVHTGSAWRARKNMRFGDKSATGSTCYGMTVPGCFISGSPSCDYAVIRLRDNAQGYGCNLSAYDVGYLGHQSPPSSNISAYLWGYPSDNMPSGWTYPTLSLEHRTDGYISIWYPDRVFYHHDSTGGMSGGPYAGYHGSSEDYRVYAVNKGGFQWPLGGYEHYGPRVRPDMISFLQQNAGN